LIWLFFDEPGMQAIRGDTGAAQAASEFTRKQDVAEFRPTIGLNGSEALC
jgi:hypothetical protein